MIGSFFNFALFLHLRSIRHEAIVEGQRRGSLINFQYAFEESLSERSAGQGRSDLPR